MSRLRVGMGIVAVTSGTAWALGGIVSLATSGRTLIELLLLLLVIGGVAAILLVAVPRGALAGPVLLISIGVLGLAIEHGMLRRSLSAHFPAFILICVGVIVAMSRSKKSQIDTGVERYKAVLFPVRRRISNTAPTKVIIHAIFGLFRLDLSEADYPVAARLWIDITILMGRVELILPEDWEVQAGRIALARHMTFTGMLTYSKLASLTEQEEDVGKNLVVLNVRSYSPSVGGVM